ncbi:MAG: hydroxymethylglutaryl-CoA lyase [Saprospiraceae bacterium]|nr:hydroxymethylglutaryl-CoA lyase [Saprospiraceae bacterium]
MVKIVECPRDAMQGIKEFIPTQKKVAYINQLLKVGFHTIDFGSFVSPKAIPQMKDTAEVVEGLDLSSTNTRLLAIVANKRGAIDAAGYDQIDFLGYPFSISETFQLRNTNATISESLGRVEEIIEICEAAGKQLVVYISMGFGNPYGDPWNTEIVAGWVDKLSGIGVRILQLSDTIGVARPESISYLFGHLAPAYPGLEIGAHLHTQPHNWKEKIATAFENGCRRFDGAIKGYGGCPMARDELTGNMPTEHLLAYFNDRDLELEIDRAAFRKALTMAAEIFPA